jgi:hypothetical protein
MLFAVTAKAQSMFLQDINGQPMFENTYSAIEGTPYLNPDWTRGTVKAKINGKTYELAKTRYDAYKDELEYEENQKPYRFGKEITEFTSDGKLFRSGFPALDNLSAQSFYHVIYEGKVALLKRYPTRIQSEKPYNSATEIKRFVKEDAFFLYKDKKLTRLEKDKKSLLEALGDKQAELEAFIKDQKLKLSKEEDILRLIEKYEQ